MFATTYETILCDEPRSHVARIVLNREKQMNAYNWRMTQELQAALAAYRDDDDLRALIITGAGERAFCTGGDISGADPEHGRKVRNAPMGHGREMRDGMQAVLALLRRIDKPSVAQINGYAQSLPSRDSRSSIQSSPEASENTSLDEPSRGRSFDSLR